MFGTGLKPAVDDLQTTTSALAEPMDKLTEQMTDLSAGMSGVADGMAAFDESRDCLETTPTTAHAAPAAGD